MKNPYEHIHWATNTRLAEMLEETANGALERAKEVEVDEENREEFLSIVNEEHELLMESARRLRNIDKRPIPFNHEAFE